MKLNAMDAYEAPRKPEPIGRPTREVELTFLGSEPGDFGGKRKGRLEKVSIPAEIRPPDLLSFRGKLFIRLKNGRYRQTTIWPVFDSLDL